MYSPGFFSSKCSLFHNSNVFGSCIIHILYTGCAKIKKNKFRRRKVKVRGGNKITATLSYDRRNYCVGLLLYSNIEHGALSHRRPASAWILHDCCRAEDNGNRNTLYTMSKTMKYSKIYKYEDFQSPSEENNSRLYLRAHREI